MEMSSEKGRIPGSELIFMLSNFMLGSIYVTTYTFGFTPRNEWLVVILAGIIYIPFALINIKLSDRFPNENIIQINDRVFGRVLGKVVSVVYCLFLLPACAVNLRFPSAFLTNIFMLETPFIVFALFLLLLCVWIAKKGIETISRVSIVLSPLIIFFIITYSLLLTNKMDVSRLLPVFDIPPKKFIQSFNTILSIYMGESFFFSMILPYVKDKKNIRKNYFIGLALGVFVMLVIALMVTLVLGNVASISTAPLVQTVRLVEVLNINARIEFIFMSFLVIVAFYKCCILFYAALLALETLLKLKSYKVIIIPVAIMVFGLIMITAANSVTLAEDSTNSIPLVIFALLFVLPIITLITAAARKLPKTPPGGDSA